MDGMQERKEGEKESLRKIMVKKIKEMRGEGRTD